MPAAQPSLLKKVAAQLGAAPSYAEPGVKASILAVAAASYGSRPTTDEVTQPTGFDPQAAALFEAVVEAAFLVGSADGDFDDAERQAFQHVVLAACGDRVAEGQVNALVADLADQLHEDGMDKRVQMVARTISRPEHAREVLRLAALLAQVSGGVSDAERGVLSKLAGELKLGSDAVDGALREVERALAD
jgi:tellurite resistance protein